MYSRVKDSILVTFVYDTDELRYMWNDSIESGESLIASIGEDNKCVNKIISDSKKIQGVN